MKYYTIHINDSGAIECSNVIKSDGMKTLVAEMYDDQEFNRLNDILHSTDDFIMNPKAYDIFKQSNIIPYTTKKVIVKRKEKKFGLLKKTKTYEYLQLAIKKCNNLICYDWINFEKSEINILLDGQLESKLKSHSEFLNYIEINKSNLSDKSYSFESKKIVLNMSFDDSIDLFQIPFYSWGTYVSEKLKSKLELNSISDVGFAEIKDELGIVWKPHFPQMKFEKKPEDNKRS